MAWCGGLGEVVAAVLVMGMRYRPAVGRVAPWVLLVVDVPDFVVR
jgi:hypothetical protein